MKFAAVLLYVPFVVAGALIKRDALPGRFVLEASTQGTSGVLYPQLMYTSSISPPFPLQTSKGEEEEELRKANGCRLGLHRQREIRHRH